MTVTTGTFPKALIPGIKKWFGDEYKDIPLVADMVFKKETSDKAFEEYQEEYGLGLAPAKAEGSAIQYDVDGQGYTARINNVVYSLGLMVTKEAITDNLYFSVGQKKAKKLARSMRQTKETVFANILNRAFTSTYAGGDGKELVATDHPTVNGTQSNELAVAADLSEASLEDALTLISLMTDSRGLRMQLTGQKLVVAPANHFNATRILSSTNQSGTANNDINAMKAMGVLPGGVINWRFLTDADAWFITTDCPTGLINQERWALSVDRDNDFSTKNLAMSAEERYGAGWGDWRGIVGSAGA